MSKLSERIRKASRMEAQPLGFVTSRAAKDATMLLGGAARDAKAASDLLKQGADFVIVGERGKVPAPSDAGQLEGALAGAWIEGEAEAAAYREAGFDFVVFDPDRTSSTAVLDEDVGYVMLLPKDASDVDMRAIAALQLDLIDIGSIDGTLTVRRQIELRRVFGLTQKPLLASVRADISVPALQALRDTNVIALVAERADDVAKLRKTIDALPPRSRRREDGERAVPIVPRATGGDDHDHDEDE